MLTSIRHNRMIWGLKEWISLKNSIKIWSLFRCCTRDWLILSALWFKHHAGDESDAVLDMQHVVVADRFRVHILYAAAVVVVLRWTDGKHLEWNVSLYRPRETQMEFCMSSVQTVRWTQLMSNSVPQAAVPPTTTRRYLRIIFLETQSPKVFFSTFILKSILPLISSGARHIITS